MLLKLFTGYGGFALVKILRNNFWIFLLVLFFCALEVAQGAPAEYALIMVEGAMVYEKPDFDSRVISYLHKDVKVVVSRQVYGAFRKVVVRKGLVGYISEVDVTTGKSSDSSAGAAPAPSPDKAQTNGENKPVAKTKRRHRRHKPVADTTYVGGFLSYINYRELIAGGKPAANLLMYGLKITGPGIIFSNAFISDFNLSVYPGAPSYYDEGAAFTPGGYLIMLDAPLLFPLDDHKDSMTYFGLGPMMTYSSYNVTLVDANKKNHAFNLEEVKVGGVLVLGYGYRIFEAIARLEAKYFIEKTNYLGVQLSVQGAF